MDEMKYLEKTMHTMRNVMKLLFCSWIGLEWIGMEWMCVFRLYM